MNAPRARQSTEAELQAFETTCNRLAGFDERVSFEWADGFLAALAAGPGVPPVEEWLPVMCGDAFERAFADPEDHAQALRSMQVRLKVLCDQLAPAALIDDPEALRLEPLISEWTDADRDKLASDEGLSAEQAAELQTGNAWALGFLDGVESFPGLWVEPDDEESADIHGALLDQIKALVLPPASEEYAAHLEDYYPKGPPTREDLLAEACWSVQELRVYWVDHAPRPPTRRVEAVPGRNEPCPCGSGKKYKKCHGLEAGR
jgi:uncharacterized protein